MLAIAMKLNEKLKKLFILVSGNKNYLNMSMT